mmetsp:Transcript_85360/g.267047  ORF Transcript_85360/g.267047 Transcript_85360/m.267047 type:complete len:305 (-) Transcript_85360:512-1426(-)
MLLGEVAVDLAQEVDLLVEVESLQFAGLLGPLRLGKSLPRVQFIDLQGLLREFRFQSRNTRPELSALALRLVQRPETGQACGLRVLQARQLCDDLSTAEASDALSILLRGLGVLGGLSTIGLRPLASLVGPGGRGGEPEDVRLRLRDALAGKVDLGVESLNVVLYLVEFARGLGLRLLPEMRAAHEDGLELLDLAFALLQLALQPLVDLAEPAGSCGRALDKRVPAGGLQNLLLLTLQLLHLPRRLLGLLGLLAQQLSLLTVLALQLRALPQQLPQPGVAAPAPEPVVLLLALHAAEHDELLTP